MSSVNDSAVESVKGRIEKYRRRVSITNWIGGGFIASIALMGADVLDNGPELIHDLVVTLLIVGGTLLATARVEFEWRGTVLTRLIGDEKLKEDDPVPPKQVEWPKRAEAIYDGAFICLLLIGLLLITGTWLSA